MPKDNIDYNEPVSIRAFSRMVGVSDTTIRQRIADRVIVKGYSPDNKKITPSIAKAELEGKPVQNRPGAPTKMPGKFGDDDDSYLYADDEDEYDYSEGIPDNVPKREADRLIALYRAKKARKEYEEVEGSLVKRDVVYEKLYAVAQSIRDKLMNVPDRCIDDVLSAGNRNLAIKRIGDEISDALTEIANTDDIQILDKR